MEGRLIQARSLWGQEWLLCWELQRGRVRQGRQRGCGVLLASQLPGAKLDVSVCFPLPWLLELLPAMATEVLLISPVSDLKGLVELRAFSPGI